MDSSLGLDRGHLLTDSLITKIAQDVVDSHGDKEARACATRFMKACCASEKHRPTSTLPQMVQWGVELDDDALYDAAVKAGYGQGDVQQALARLLEKEHSRRANPKGFGNQDWDGWYALSFSLSLFLTFCAVLTTLSLSRRLGVIVHHVPSLTRLGSVLSRFASKLGDAGIEASFYRWKDATLMA